METGLVEVAPGVKVALAEFPLLGSVTVIVQVTLLCKSKMNLPSLLVSVFCVVRPEAVAVTNAHGSAIPFLVAEP